MRRPLAVTAFLASAFCLGVFARAAGGQIPTPPPSEWTPVALAVWVVGIIVSLLGGGFLTKVYLQRTGFLNEREKESWVRLKTQLDNQAATIAQQDERLDRQRDDIEGAYTKMQELADSNFKFRVDAGKMISQLESSLFDEKEHAQAMRADLLSAHEKLKTATAKLDQATAQLHACEDRDAAKARAIQQLTEQVAELEHKVEDLRKYHPGEA